MDLVELYLHRDAGRSTSELAMSLGMDRKTVQKYLAPAEAEGLAPGLGLAATEWRDMVAGWFPTVVDGRLRQVTRNLRMFTSRRASLVRPTSVEHQEGAGQVRVRFRVKLGSIPFQPCGGRERTAHWSGTGVSAAEERP